MKEHILYKCAEKAIQAWSGKNDRPTYHYTFAVRKNKIIAIGRNKPDFPSVVVSKFAKIYKIKKWIQFPYLHSEVDMICQIDPSMLNKQTEILNLRINRHGEFRFCKPCINCQVLLDSFELSKISWTKNLPEDDPKIIIVDGYQQLNLKNIYFVNKMIKKQTI